MIFTGSLMREKVCHQSYGAGSSQYLLTWMDMVVHSLRVGIASQPGQVVEKKGVPVEISPRQLPVNACFVFVSG